MSIIRKPIITVIYEGANITADITPFLKTFAYTDKISNDSPDIDITFEDRNRLFQQDWFPQNKSRFSFTLQYEQDERRLQIDNFEIDLLEFSFTHSGDSVSVGALQTPLSKDLRQKRSVEYENTTLKQIIDTIASRQGLKVVGKVKEIEFERITQNEISDLEFLAQLAEDYGHLTKIEGEQLIVYEWNDLYSASADFELDRNTLTSFSVKKKLVGIYSKAVIVYEKTDDEQTIEASIDAMPMNDSEDVLTINRRSESLSQATAKAEEKLRKANVEEYSGRFEIEGEYWVKAGINFSLSDFGHFDGVWNIQEAKHSFSVGRGWIVNFNAFRMRD